MNRVISCVQINSQHSKAASIELNKKDFEILFITEPYQVCNKVSTLIYRWQTQVLTAEGAKLDNYSERF